MPSKKSHRKQIKNQEYNKTISSKARNAGRRKSRLMATLNESSNKK